MNEIIMSFFASTIVGLISAFSSIKVASIKYSKIIQKLEDANVYNQKQMKVIDKKLTEHNNYAKIFEEVKIEIVKLSKDMEYLKKG